MPQAVWLFAQMVRNPAQMVSEAAKSRWQRHLPPFDGCHIRCIWQQFDPPASVRIRGVLCFAGYVTLAGFVDFTSNGIGNRQIELIFKNFQKYPDQAFFFIQLPQAGFHNIVPQIADYDGSILETVSSGCVAA